MTILFDKDIPTNCEMVQRDINLQNATINEIRFSLQEYNSEYQDNLNETIISIFNEFLNNYILITNITRNIIARSNQINTLVNSVSLMTADNPSYIMRNNQSKIMLNRCKYTIWYVLLCEYQVRTTFELFDDIILLFHITQRHNNNNSNNPEFNTLMENVTKLLNDYKIYINDINIFQQGLNTYKDNITVNLNKTIHNIEHDHETSYNQLNNQYEEFEQRINTYTDTLNLLVRGSLQSDTIANPNIVTAPAFEIHNYFKSLNINRIKEIMTLYSNNHQQNINTIDESKNDATIFKPFYIFIQKSGLFSNNEKLTYINKFKTIYEYIINNDFDDDLIRQQPAINIAINFIVRQDDNYISEFIRSYQDACLNAFNKGGYSCVPGMIERILTENGIIIKALCLNGCNEPYNELNALFNRTLNDVIKEWSNTYLEDGPRHEELVSLSEEYRKKHLINFIKQSYNNIIDEKLAMQIEEELDKYEKNGVFKNLYFGGKKRHYKKKITKKRTNKRKQTNKKIKKNKTNKRRIKKFS